MPLMGYREYARHRGVSLRAVQKAIEAQRISVTENKKIDSDVADREWDGNTDASRVAMMMSASVTPIMPRPKPAAPPPEIDPDDGDEPPTGDDRAATEYREHRSMRERYQALKQQLEYEQMAGTLINVDDAKRIAYTSFRALRDSIMNVAPRIKDQLAAESDSHVIELLLENELSAALAGIDIGKLLKDEDD